jgi:Na+-driven multidrug efflux pump
LVTLTIPVLFSLAAEPLTGLVDTAFIARLGSSPMAALGVLRVWPGIGQSPFAPKEKVWHK